MNALPDFNDNPSNIKNEPLTQAIVDNFHCQPFLLQILEETTARLKRKPRVLDYGCGRGEMVAYLRRLGYECYGVEIRAAS